MGSKEEVIWNWEVGRYNIHWEVGKREDGKREDGK